MNMVTPASPPRVVPRPWIVLASSGVGIENGFVRSHNTPARNRNAGHLAARGGPQRGSFGGG